MSVIKGSGVYETVTCYLKKGNKVLLLFRNKKEVDINKNKWIGVGGHIEEGETPIDAVVREVKEETKEIEVMHLFVCTKFKGRMTSDCNEGTLEWKTISKLDDIPMWEGDRIFLPPVLNDAPFFEMVLYYKGDVLTKYKLLGDGEEFIK